MTLMMIVGLCIGLAVIVVLTTALWSRPADLFGIFFVLGVCGLAVTVSWNNVEQHQAQKASIPQFDQRVATGPFDQSFTTGDTVTATAPTHPRAGS
jgi:Flp pilus assembly protein TadB